MSKINREPLPSTKRRAPKKPDEYTVRLTESYSVDSDIDLPRLPKGKFGTYSKIHEVRIRRTLLEAVGDGLRKNPEAVSSLLNSVLNVVATKFTGRAAMDLGSTLGSVVSGGSAATPPPTPDPASTPDDWSPPTGPGMRSESFGNNIPKSGVTD